uniref:Glutathione S-transferase theta 1 n=1 Tax=Rhinolophus ferrumequinum TaxID=59479 RepID=A0A671FEC5_RHIFE
MVLELYLDLLSQACGAVYIFAKKNGILFELRTMELLKGQPLSDAFAQDGDFTLSKRGPLGLSLPAYRGHGRKVHRTRKQLQEQGACLSAPKAGLTPNSPLCLPTHQMMFPVFLGESVSPEMLAVTLAELDVTLKILEGKFFQNKAFHSGHNISLADLMLPSLPVGAGCQVFEGQLKLAAWLQHVEAAVGEVLFQEAHEGILKAKDFPPADLTIKQKLMPGVLAMI